MEEKGSERSVLYFFLALFCVALFLSGKLIAPFFSIIILGMVCAGVFTPLYRLLNKKLSSPFSSTLVCLLLFFLILVPAVFFVGVLSKEAYSLYIMGKNAVFSHQLKDILEETRFLERLNTFLATVGIEKQVTFDQLIRPVSEVGRIVGFSLFEKASFVASNIFKFVFYFCFMLVVVFYLLMDGRRVIEYIFELSPLPREHNEKLVAKFTDIAGAVLVVNGLGGLIQGTAGGILFFFLGLNSPFLWGVIMGFLAFLPIVGIGLVFIPTAGLLLLKKRIAAGIFMLVFYAVLSWGVEYLFKPKMVGDRVRMHPLIVFFSIIGGLKVYGVLGIIYGPLIITLFFTLAEIYFTNFQALIEPGKHKKSD